MAGYLPQNRGNKSASRPGPLVSRKLRAAGWNVSPSARRHDFDGIFVSAQGDSVSVWVRLGSPERNASVALSIELELSVWGQVGNVHRTQSGFTDTHFVHMTYGC